MRSLELSPSGGVWVISFGTILRVVERPGTDDGLEIIERPSAWHGLMLSDAEDLIEQKSGDLWIATLAGLVHIPPEVRNSAPGVPPVALVEASVDGQSLPIGETATLSYRKDRIALRFAALSYRDPALLRYQVRLDPDAPWRNASGPPSFRFVDLPAGTWHAEVRASLDGTRWSPEPARFSFTILPPFWSTWWFALFVGSLLIAIAYVLYRIRLARLLALERVRTRIAADLHDDIGASLSRMAIQSELARRKRDGDPALADRLLHEIGESARALVDSMGDIVWSVDPRRDNLTSVVTRVREFALDMLEPPGITLVMRTPSDTDRIRLTPEQRRHLYLIAKEAVNNITKHAGCRNVSIGLALEGRRLSLEVNDDGRGFEGDPPAGRGGQGLASMRSRAGQLGGALSVESGPESGTRLKLSFDLARVPA